MKKLTTATLVALVIVILVGCATGCGGSGNVAASLFMGTRDIQFYDADQSNSTQSGDFEVVVDRYGKFDQFGISWIYGTDYVEKGKVLRGWINPDRTFHVEVKIDTAVWPNPGQLEESYYMVVNGQVTPSGGRYEGTAQIKYYQTDDFSPGNEIKDIPYDITMTHLPDRGQEAEPGQAKPN